MKATSTRSVVNPRSTCWSVRNDRSSSPAAARRTTDNATSATTIAERSRVLAFEAVAFEPPCFNAIRQVESRGMQCRHEAEDHRRYQRESEREEHNGRVDPHLVDPGQVGGCQRDDSLNEHRREQEARQPGHAAEHAVLGEQLPHHAAAAGTERGAERDLARPARGPRQQEVRDVGAPDEPHDAHGAHQRP